MAWATGLLPLHSKAGKIKRVDLIVSAFKKMPDKKLIVASGGSELEHLQHLASNAPNITFTGWIDHEELVRLMGNAIATIYMPKDEDFGISPVESMAAGKPVIGVNEGGVMETVMDGETGTLIAAKVGKIVREVDALNPKSAAAMQKKCETVAQKFNTDFFLSRLTQQVHPRK